MNCWQRPLVEELLLTNYKVGQLPAGMSPEHKTSSALTPAPAGRHGLYYRRQLVHALHDRCL